MPSKIYQDYLNKHDIQYMENATNVEFVLKHIDYGVNGHDHDGINSPKIYKDNVIGMEGIYSKPEIDNLFNKLESDFDIKTNNLRGDLFQQLAVIKNSVEDRVKSLEDTVKAGVAYHYNPAQWKDTKTGLNQDSVQSDHTMFVSVNYIREILKWIATGCKNSIDEGAMPSDMKLGLAYDAENAGTSKQPQNLGQKWVTTPVIPLNSPGYIPPPNFGTMWIES